MTDPETRLEPRAADKLSVLLALGFFVTSILQGAIPVLAPGLRSEEGVSSAGVGLLMSVFLVGYAATTLLAGAAAARFPGRVLAAGFAAMVLGSLLFASSSSYVWYALARVLQGAGGGTMLPAAGVLLVRFVPTERLGRAWSIYGGSSGIGYVLLLLVLARVVEAGGHRPFFLILAAMVAAVGVFTFTSTEVRSAPPVDSPRLALPALGADLWTLIRSPRVTLLAMANVAGISVSVGTLTWTPSYIHDELGATLGVAAAVTAGFAAAQFAGAPVVAYLLTKVGYLPLLVGVFASEVVALLLLPVFESLVPTFFIVLFIGLLTMLAFSPSMSLIPMLVEMRLVGMAGGYLNAVGFVGALFGPWLFGVFIDQGRGYGTGYGMLAGFAVGGLTVVAFLWRSLRMGGVATGVVH